MKRRELYHLRRDISEQYDLSKGDPERTDRLFQELMDYLEAVDAETPTQRPGSAFDVQSQSRLAVATVS